MHTQTIIAGIQPLEAMLRMLPVVVDSAIHKYMLRSPWTTPAALFTLTASCYAMHTP
jgi:hypothetical protein